MEAGTPTDASAGLLTRLAGGTFGQVIDALQLALQERVDKHLCPLPKVVVIGSENVGKSCLLENLTKLSLFPAGDGMKTRCPIVLNLHPSTADEGPIYRVSNFGKGAAYVTTDILLALHQIQAYMPPEGSMDARPIYVDIEAVRSLPVQFILGVQSRWTPCHITFLGLLAGCQHPCVFGADPACFAETPNQACARGCSWPAHPWTSANAQYQYHRDLP